MPAPVLIVTGVSRGIARAVAEELQLRNRGTKEPAMFRQVLNEVLAGLNLLTYGSWAPPCDSGSARHKE
jgi:hypothetical protein